MASSWLGDSYRIFTDAYVVRWLKHSIEDAWLTGGVSEDSLGILYGIFEGFCRERRLSFLFLWDYSEDIEINICDLVGLKGFFFGSLFICPSVCLLVWQFFFGDWGWEESWVNWVIALIHLGSDGNLPGPFWQGCHMDEAQKEHIWKESRKNLLAEMLVMSPEMSPHWRGGAYQ